MARVSRKNSQTDKPLAPTPALFKVAGYARLSLEDKDYGDGGSLENQILMIKNFVSEKPDLELCSMHSDNGLTGTNFNRRGFEMLMDEIRQGKVNCIVVKDLSRFGRDYIEAGNFLEVIFPRLGVRFISIGDNYDSFDPRCQGEGMTIALKNMINSFYAKDISTKVRTAYEVKRRNGEFTGKMAPFGYMKSPENKNKLIVDGEAAEIVRLIFKLRLEGMGIYPITRYLSENTIPAPGHYGFLKGTNKEERYRNPQPWDITVVKAILENIVYLGHLAMGKTQTKTFHKQEDVPQSEWVIAYNTHEPIISQADFEAVAVLIKQETDKRNGYTKHQREPLPEYILEGMVFCADCGRAYRRLVALMRDNVRYRITYNCVTCNRNHPKNTYRHYPQKELYQVVYAAIRQQIELCADTRKLIEGIKASKGVSRRQTEMDTEMRRIQKWLDRYPTVKLKLYNDLCAGVLDESEYQLLGNQYEAERIKLTSQIEQLQAEKDKLQPTFVENNRWMSMLERFMDEKELTREMVTALIERIEVNGNLNTEIFFKYQDEYKELLSFIRESEGYLHG